MDLLDQQNKQHDNTHQRHKHHSHSRKVPVVVTCSNNIVQTDSFPPLAMQVDAGHPMSRKRRVLPMDTYDALMADLREAFGSMFENFDRGPYEVLDI